MKPTTRAMSDRQEARLAMVLGGRVTRGSGNQFNDQGDGKHSYREQAYTFCWDGKSTLGKSISVSLEMWAKICEQAHWARPMLSLGFFRNERLSEIRPNLVVLADTDFSEILEDANAYRRIKEQGCLDGNHDFWDPEGEPDIFRRHPEARSGPPVKGYPSSDCQVCGASIYNQPSA